MHKINYSPAAIRDLEQIGDYISDEFKNPTAAWKTIDRIQDTIDKLAESPRIGTPLSARFDNTGDYRILVCGNYLAFYRVQASDVYIDRILYGKRDYITILFGELPEEID